MTHRRGRDLLPVSHPLPIDDLFHYAGTRPPVLPAQALWGSKIGDGPLACGFRRRVRIRWLVHPGLAGA
jgi:hypothetical protein